MLATRVLVADDHPLLRRGVVAALAAEPDLEVVAEAGDADSAVRLAIACRPDVVLADLGLPGAEGASTVVDLRAALPRCPVLVLTVSDAGDDLLACLRAGATGYLLKGVAPADLVRAVRAVARGSTVVDPALTDALVAASRTRPSAPAAPSPLTERELEVLGHLATGRTNRSIGATLFISENTVKNHVRSILEKLGLHSRTEAVAHALRAGLLERAPLR